MAMAEAVTVGVVAMARTDALQRQVERGEMEAPTAHRANQVHPGRAISRYKPAAAFAVVRDASAGPARSFPSLENDGLMRLRQLAAFGLSFQV
ncbi:hypothetical protein BST10_21930 [Mycolicibacter algericus DSM 45454]|uniref:Uncharacterized protein n=2 Tax=Mycolicibacter algericus TaxID=1288388 RepID=A0A7I9YGI1_MYCAL|nr:hypothetical protein BST10_21930 [Mycolicibacter algericus DSM 45454]GFG87754.1 hypothetical protein MALGJ_44300 [Mycolicibacter algericus]